MPGTALVIGANRGIGLQLVKTLQSHSYHVTGTVRPSTVRASDPTSSSHDPDDTSVADLKATGADILELDYLDPESISAAAAKWGEKPLDLLINCAGVSPRPEKSLEADVEDMDTQYRVMCLGPFMAIRAFLPALNRRGEGELSLVQEMLDSVKYGAEHIGPSGKVLNVSSDWGSISMSDGNWLGYRLAKAGLNMLTKTLAEELKKSSSGVVVGAVNPGFIATKLSGWHPEANDDVAVTCEGMLQVAEKLWINNSGGFWNWDGEVLAW